jgi:hypothetical protein
MRFETELGSWSFSPNSRSMGTTCWGVANDGCLAACAFDHKTSSFMSRALQSDSIVNQFLACERIRASSPNMILWRARKGRTLDWRCVEAPQPMPSSSSGPHGAEGSLNFSKVQNLQIRRIHLHIRFRSSQGAPHSRVCCTMVLRVALVGVLVLTLSLSLAPVTATTYYVSSNGSDTAAGTSPATSWRTLKRAGQAALADTS